MMTHREKAAASKVLLLALGLSFSTCDMGANIACQELNNDGWKMSTDLLQLGIFSLKPFYGEGLDFELGQSMQSFGWLVGSWGTAHKASERLDKCSSTGLRPLSTGLQAVILLPQRLG